MVRKKTEGSTRQLFASIREELYLAAKARATEQRMSLREYMEMALELALSGAEGPPEGPEQTPEAQAVPSIWEDEYLRMQVQQPVGSPVELTREEAERVVRATFGPGPVQSAGEDEPDG